MERLTEACGPDYFVIKGSKTVYHRNPRKSSRLACALAKLFQYEESGLDPDDLKKVETDS